MKLLFNISIGEKRKIKRKADYRHTVRKSCILFLTFFGLTIQGLLAQQYPDLPNPSSNIQTATIGSLVIPMDNNNQNIGSPFNLKAYGLIHKLLLNDIPVKWVIRSGKGKDSVDFSATAERLYPTYVSPAMKNFIASAFIIDSGWVNNAITASGQSATQIITSFGNNVAVFRLTQDVAVDVRYTLNFHPKLAVFDNGGNEDIHVDILDAAGVTNYITTGAGVFPGIFECFTFASEPHWAGSFPADTPITNNIRDFVQAGGNLLVECRGILTYENLSGFHTTNGIDIKNATVVNNYHNNDMAFMQFQGAMKANESGSERNWVRSAGSSWVPGFYYGISHTNIDTIVASGSHLIDPDSAGGNVFYLGGHDYSPFNASLLQINAARLYLNATLIPSGRPSPFNVNIASNVSICSGTSVTLGGSPTGPAGSTYAWSPAIALNDSTSSNPLATPALTTTYFVSVYKNGCTSQGSVTVTVAPPLNSEMDSTVVLCIGGNDGSASVAVTGGVAPYAYLWSNGQTSSVATGLSAGSYSVQVNGAGCIITDTITVTEPTAPLTAAVTSNNISCFGSGDGTATVSASGGTSGYAYLWSNGQSGLSVGSLTAGNYSVTITDSKGCDTISSFSIAEPTALSSFITPSSQVTCFGASNGTVNAIVSGGTPGYSYLWNSGDTTATVNGLPAGNYIVAITDTNGCTDTSSALITEPMLAIAASISQTDVICPGGSNGAAAIVVSGGVPPYSYLWTNGQTNSSDSGLIAGNYSVQVTDSMGCITNFPFSISQPDSITSLISSTPSSSCSNNGTASIAVSGGTPSYTYLWNTGQTTSTITGLLPGVYTVTVTDSYNCIFNDAAAVSLATPSAVPANAGPDGSYCFGDSIQLNASGGVIYSWFPATGLSDPNVSNPVASPLNTTNYIVYVTDSAGCLGIDSMNLIVHSLPPADAGADAVICQNSSAILQASGGINYTWSPVNGLSDPNISNPVVSISSTTTYTVAISNVNGCLASDTINVLVNSIPAVFAGNDTSICLNDSSRMNASGGIRYSWSPAVGLSSDTISNPMAAPPSTTNYTVLVTDSNGCSDAAYVNITVNMLPVLIVTTNQSICLNSSCTLTSSGGINYAWSPSAGLSDTSIFNPVASPDSTTTYVVTVSDANGCISSAPSTVTINPLPVATVDSSTICLGESTILTATGGVQYDWSSGQTTSSISVSPSNTANYEVIVTDANGCIDSANSTVTVNSIPSVSAGNDVNICFSDSSRLNVSGGFSYSWFPTVGLSNASVPNPVASPPTTTSYTVLATDSNGCSSTDDVIVSVTMPPVVSVTGSHTICSNNSSTLIASGGINYIWSPPTGLSDTSIFNPVASPDSTTTYVVTVSDANGCISSASTTVSVNSFPVATVNSPTICFGESALLTATGGVQYDWSSGQNTSSITVSPAISANYDVVVTDMNGCTDTASTTVIVDSIPTVYAGMDTTIMAGMEIQLHASAGGVAYEWSSVIDLDCSTCLNPRTRPLHTQQYIIYTVNANGCRNSDTVTVYVDDCLALYVPNAFTPSNRDELNDVFYISGNCINEFEFYIFDRWGMQIFESRETSKGWDGTFMGNPVQQDIYVWVAKVKSISGLNIYQTGKVFVMK